MINDNTIVSSFNDRPTLLEWLKKVEEALKTDTATAIKFVNTSPNHYVASIEFANGSKIESGDIAFPDTIDQVTITDGELIVNYVSGAIDNLGKINAYEAVIVVNSETNTTKIVNNVEVGGNLKVNSSISSSYNAESSIVISENPQEGLTLSLVDGVNFVKEKDDLIEVHAYIQMTKTSGSYAYFDGLTVSTSLIPSHNHTYLVPFGKIWGQVSGYMYARIDKAGTIRLGDWSGLPDETRYIYIDFLYYRH